MATVLALGVMLPFTAAAQTVLDNSGNTTGSLAPNTTGSLSPALSQATPGTTGGAATTGTTSPTTTGTTAPTAVAPATAPAPRDAAILVCAQDLSSGTPRLVVFSSSTSAGAPTVPPGLPCAQALSDLFVAGFSVIDVLPFNQQLQYTLVR